MSYSYIRCPNPNCTYIWHIGSDSHFRIFTCPVCERRFRGIHAKKAYFKWQIRQQVSLHETTVCPNGCTYGGGRDPIWTGEVKQGDCCKRCGISLPIQPAIQESKDPWDDDEVQEYWQQKKLEEKLKFVEDGQILWDVYENTPLSECPIKPKGTYANLRYWNVREIDPLHGYENNDDMKFLIKKKDWIRLGHNREFMQTADVSDLHTLKNNLVALAENEWGHFSQELHFEAIENIVQVIEERKLTAQYQLLEQKEELEAEEQADLLLPLFKEEQVQTQVQEQTKTTETPEQAKARAERAKIRARRKEQQAKQLEQAELEQKELEIKQAKKYDYLKMAMDSHFIKTASKNQLGTLKQNLLDDFKFSMSDHYRLALNFVEKEIKRRL